MGILSSTNLSSVYKRFIFSTAGNAGDGTNVLQLAWTKADDGDTVVTRLALTELYNYHSPAAKVMTFATVANDPLVTFEGNIQIGSNEIKNGSGTSVFKFTSGGAGNGDVELYSDMWLSGDGKEIRFGFGAASTFLKHVNNHGLELKTNSSFGGGNDPGTVLHLIHNTTQTVALGHALNLDFSLEYTSAESKLSSRIQILPTNISNAGATADIVFSSIASNSLAEKARITSDGKIRLAGNVIQASDGGNTITMDTSDNVTIAGDLTISGNDIKSSDGSTCMTLKDHQGDINTVEFADRIYGTGLWNKDDDDNYISISSAGISMDSDNPILLLSSLEFGSNLAKLGGGGTQQGNANGISVWTPFTDDDGVNAPLIFYQDAYTNVNVGYGIAIKGKSDLPVGAYHDLFTTEAVVTDISDNAECVSYKIRLLSSGTENVEAFQVTHDGVISSPKGFDGGDAAIFNIGNDDDLVIKHDGNNSIIDHTGTGDLLICPTNAQTIRLGYGGLNSYIWIDGSLHTQKSANICPDGGGNLNVGSNTAGEIANIHAYGYQENHKLTWNSSTTMLEIEALDQRHIFKLKTQNTECKIGEDADNDNYHLHRLVAGDGFMWTGNNDTTVMRLTIGGDLGTNRLGINTSAAAGALDVRGEYDETFVARFWNLRNDADAYGVGIFAGGNTTATPTEDTIYVGFLTSNNSSYNGSIIHKSSNGLMELATTSDERLKENIEDTEIDGLSIINNLKVRKFKWKESGLEVDAGFIAQEVQSVYPNAAQGTPDGMRKSGVEGEEDKDVIDEMSVSKGSMIEPMVKAIQELSAKVAALENA